jgi:oligopeptidase A
MPFERHTNPLLDFSGLARFGEIRPEHITPAVDTLLQESRQAVKVAGDVETAPAWEALVEPLDTALERLSRAWGNVSHLNAVVDTPALREQYNANVPKLTAFWTELAQDLRLYEQFRRLAAAGGLTASQHRVVDNELRDFRLGGADLDATGKERLRQLREREVQASTRFAENVLDATNAFALYVEEDAELAGVPEDALELYREAAAADGKSGYKITLQYPSYSPVLQYAEDRALRERLYRAYVTRASEFGKPEWDNGALMIELLRLRRDHAQMLGYRNFAELSLVPKMAATPEEVLAFLRDLGQRARPHAQRDMAELREFAARELGLADLQSWDISFASEKLRQARYDYSDQELKRYFPEPKVLAGLFKVIETLFGVAIRLDSGPTWHPDVRLFRIETTGGELVGQFYLDLYAREHKRGGAWQDDARCRHRSRRGVQTPVSFLTCNFTRPVGGRPALFTHDEVLTLFHEFGHGLHHLLTRVDELGVSGIRGVEWDAVELPSQFLENFAWEWDVLQILSGHIDHGGALPRALYDKMLAARKFQSGMGMARQLELGLVDMRLHSKFDPSVATPAIVQELVQEVRREVAVVFPPEYSRGLLTFSHVFAGGYAAGYYSYLWAEVLSADSYGAFEESGRALDQQLGARFRDEILAVGGSRPSMDSFVAFRGRKPQIDALLRQHGMH